MTPDDFETIIGLEIHVELNTQSKIFSPAPNRFGDEPNTNISSVCLGMPGSLPVLNQEAVKKAVQFGLAVGAQIQEFSTFDRKSYFYPDQPRNFQITQFYRPILVGGSVVARVDGQEKSFAIRSAHLEDDTGMLKHFSQFTGVDYNRAGVPLIEIVSHPCIHSPKDAAAYASAVRAILRYIDASDCNMEEGSLRMDANISVRLKGETTLRNKIEIKNMNSFSNLELALESERERQIQAYLTHPNVPFDQVITQATYRYDTVLQKTIQMRAKEEAEDYRYFPEPDLPPLIVSKEYIESLKEDLPELPLDRTKRYRQSLGISEHLTEILVANKPLSDYFEQALKHTQAAKPLANWIITEFGGRYKETGITVDQSDIPPQHIADLVNMIEEGVISGKIAKKVADDLIKTPSLSPREHVKNTPEYQTVTDTSFLEPLVNEVLTLHQQSVQDFLSGKDKAFAFLVGQIMKRTKGQASPEVVNTLLKDKISRVESALHEEM